jgi:hypothetical protein
VAGWGIYGRQGITSKGGGSWFNEDDHVVLVLRKPWEGEILEKWPLKLVGVKRTKGNEL